MKANNKNLHKAKDAKNDEFYTQIEDIEKELKNYKSHFNGKVVYCNCDDPEWSNFYLYFSRNFEHLGLKRLISTHYDKGQGSYKLEVFADINGDGKINQLDTIKTPLTGNGDFRSDECIAILKEADIVVTNPPFSLFREFIDVLMTYDKKFLVVGNKNAITYKEVFKHIKENNLWLGCTSPDGFRQPEENEVKQMKGLCLWFTNLDVKKRHDNLELYKTYSSNEYPKYDNYDAINVDKTCDIPKDYTGAMGVPITFLNVYNPDQFEILGQGQGHLYRELTKNGLDAKFVENYYKNGGKGQIKEDHPVLGYYKNGKAIIPYMRVVIKNKTL
jgi:hypothetical protein